jgi:hypothetical protein
MAYPTIQDLLISGCHTRALGASCCYLACMPGGGYADTRSQTKIRVSPGLMLLPAPRLP